MEGEGEGEGGECDSVYLNISIVLACSHMYIKWYSSLPSLPPFLLSCPSTLTSSQWVNSIVGVLRSRPMFVLLVTSLGSSLCYYSTQHSLSFC